MDGIYNEHNLGWLAGIVDGEGSIFLTRHHKTEFRAPTISITNSSKTIIAEIVRITGINSVSKQKKYKAHHKQCYLWKTSYRKAIEIIKLVEPYLIDEKKKKRAQYLLNYDAVSSRNGKYSKELLSKRREFESIFDSLS